MTGEFDDIRPYNDAEVRAVLDRLVAHPEFVDTLLGMQLGSRKRCLSWWFRPFVKRSLSKIFAGIDTVADLQNKISVQLHGVLEQTGSKLSVSGIEKLDLQGAYLFMSNHRDIAMDPALTNLALHDHGMETVRIAIGDNLLTKPYVSDLMRVNKSFIVKRSFAGRREKLTELTRLSRYIRNSLLEDRSSIWIAQREGRAKDGVDRTETALLKMLTLSKGKPHSFSEAISELTLIPVAISYELDPCDADKGKELNAIRDHGEYAKLEHEDLDSIYRGIVGEKGRIHIAFGEPVVDVENADQAAAEIDRQIIDLYHLQPTNLLAYQILEGENDIWREFKQASGLSMEDWRKAEQLFQQRMAGIDESCSDIVIEMYANPVYSKLTQRDNQACG